MIDTTENEERDYRTDDALEAFAGSDLAAVEAAIRSGRVEPDAEMRGKLLVRVDRV